MVVSDICEEDACFKELVRYIHLNPLRAKIISSISDLEKYCWCGHGVVVGKVEYGWQDRQYVLAWFGRSEKQAAKAYRRFVVNGVGLGKQPQLAGGGLIRSMGGWSQVMSMRKSGEKQMTDERVLGSGDFVENLIQEADQKVSRQFADMLGRKQIKQIISDACMKEDISVEELKGGSRRAPVSRLRTQITLELIEKHGITPAEVARQFGITISAVSKIIARSKSK